MLLISTRALTLRNFDGRSKAKLILIDITTLLGQAVVTNEVNELSDRELEFYSRQIVLKEIGYSGQLKLKNSKVCIVGLGELGSPAAFLLASLGVGIHPTS